MSRMPSASPTSQCGFGVNRSFFGASCRTTLLSCSSLPGGTRGSISFGIHSTASLSSCSSVVSSASIARISSPTARMRALTSSFGGPPRLARLRSACSDSFFTFRSRTTRSSSRMRSSGASNPRALRFARTFSGSARMRSRGFIERVPLSGSSMYDVVLVAFEGPDRYSFVGGLATRMIDLADALVARGHNVRHIFIGDPKLPAVEERDGGRLVLERWGQWISVYHPKDVYDGEDGKWRDFSRTAPAHLVDLIAASAAAG